jgi:signal peptidase I
MPNENVYSLKGEQGYSSLERVRESEDIREALLVVGKATRKGPKSDPTDRDYLLALLLTCRKFSRLDALLHELGCSARRLKAALKNLPSTTAYLGASQIFEASAQWARQDTENTKRNQSVQVDVEHWLKALCESSDVELRKLFITFNISPTSIDEAMLRCKRSMPQRTVLFFGKEALEVVIFVLTFLILIKSLFGELRLIPSESMVPGLKIDDRLVIERVTHWFRPYQRGDILVFYPPMTNLGRDPWSVFMRITGFSGLVYKKEDNVDIAYIKRLIGLPGDTIEVRPNVGVFVNGKQLYEPYVNEIADTCTFMQPPYCGTVKVHEGEYYMMGDNRNLSWDSRYWGFEKQGRIIGRAVFRLWPMNRVGLLEQPPYQAKP